MDDNRSGDLNFDEFRNGMQDLGLVVSNDEYQKLFQLFDRDGSGTVKYDEFLRSIRVIKISLNVYMFNFWFFFFIYSHQCQRCVMIWFRWHSPNWIKLVTVLSPSMILKVSTM